MPTPSERSEVSDAIYAKRWWTLGTLCLALIVIGVDNTILNVALPSIVRDLDASGSQLQLMVDAYTIVFACLLLTVGIPRRPLRPPARPHVRPAVVRHLLRGGVDGELSDPAHRGPRPDGPRRRLHLPDHPVHPDQHLPGSRRALRRDRDLGRRVGPRHRPRPSRRRPARRAVRMVVGVSGQPSHLCRGPGHGMAVRPEHERPRRQSPRPARCRAVHPRIPRSPCTPSSRVRTRAGPPRSCSAASGSGSA